MARRSPWLLGAVASTLLVLSGCDTGAGGATSTGPSTSQSQLSTPLVDSALASHAAPTPAPSSAPATSSSASPSPSAPSAPAGVAMPEPRLTPGETFSGVSASQVCTSGYASSVRHVTPEQYHQVYAAYGIPYPQPSGTYELDHLIPLELGGDNADANLWPEPANPKPGFHEKDQLENVMHDAVCSGRLDLTEAQREISGNWYAAYQRYVGG